MATKTQVQNFIKMIAPIAVRQAKKHGNKIYASVCIAQACCESAYGTTLKMKNANAVFGIKVGKSKWHFGTAWKDKAYSTKTKECYDGKTYVEIEDFFRAYNSIEDATEDYYDLLCTASRYKKAINAKNYKECIKAIAIHYATAELKDHSYSKTIISIIEKNNLIQYDGNPYILTSKLMKRGSKGESVKWLQWELNRNGANLDIDGEYGRKTYEAVIKYQQANKLLVDGETGSQTIKSLKGE